MNHIQPFIVGDYLFVELLSSTRPFFVHRVVDLSEREFSYFKSFKNVQPEYLANPVFSTDLAHEASTLRALHNPAVPQFYDYGVVNGQAYLVYRYVWGKSVLQILRELKRHQKMLSDAYAVHIASEVARILAKAHSMHTKVFPEGVVHYNLSPRNILISYSGQVNIVSFGHRGPRIARENLEELDFRNLSYLSPEQVSGTDLSFKSDIFTLGSILYEMLTGAPPFLEKAPDKVIHRISRCSFSAASSINPIVPRELDRLLSRCLTAYTNDRFPSAAELARELDDYMLHHYPEFRSGKITRLMKSLFNDEIVADIRFFKDLGENIMHRDKSLIQGIARRMFDEIQEGRRRTGDDTMGIEAAQLGLKANRQHTRPAAASPAPAPLAAPASTASPGRKRKPAKPDPSLREPVTISKTFEAIGREGVNHTPRQDPFFENEDKNLIGPPLDADSVRPRPVTREHPVAELVRSPADLTPTTADAPSTMADAHPQIHAKSPSRPHPKARKATGAMLPDPTEPPRLIVSGVSEVIEPTGDDSGPMPAIMRNTAVAPPEYPTRGQTEFVDARDQRNALIGTEIGEYAITGILGWGGMGTVYEAVSTTIGKEVAIKVLDPAYCDDPMMAQRFLAEAKAVNSIRNPNIIDIYSFGIFDEKYHYFVMEKLNGTTLGNYLQLNKTVSFAVGAEILTQVFSAVTAAHGKGIIHRDLKPDNIYLEKRPLMDNYVKILDFGIAKFNIAGSKTAAVKTGTPMGTPQYMSPEQCTGEGVTEASDIYTLGVIVFEMFTGHLPFKKNSYLEMLLAHLREPPRLPSSLVQMDPELENLILWALQKDPEKRPHTVRELAEPLLAYLQGKL
ncbi:protein kinase [Myxococcota bacterium]|nr:protein kinase [Myxococcota bacterium]